MKVSLEEHNQKKALLASMQQSRQPFWQHWRDCADYILPQRYVWLASSAEQRLTRRNSMILDSTGTRAARTLASGMMNGITSPARPWFKLNIPGLDFDQYPMAAVWCDEVVKRMLRVMAESNFYNSMAVLYLDLVVFGTACSLIYDSEDKTIHCFNPALGEFYLVQDPEHRVNGLARDFEYTVMQLVKAFGLENCSETVQNYYKQGGGGLLQSIKVVHMIMPTEGDGPMTFDECYWEANGPTGTMLKKARYYDFPAITPRWELASNDVYGTSPAMDALPDIIQLQHETKKKAQALDKLVSPPVLADIQLKGQPTALLPNGVTYVARLNDTAGVRPIYTVNPPLGEMSADIANVQARIQESFHNELFQMISQLDTVRSATEIDARREEKLVLLGPVLERFENEALDPAIKRIFGIMDRKGLLPEVPPELVELGAEIEIQYVSILSAAQSAVGTAPIERLLQVIGNVAPIWPEAKLIPNIPELLNEYALDIGVKQKNLNTKQVVADMIAAANEQNAQQEAVQQAVPTAQAGKLLSETDVGGGANALQRLLGSVA